VQSSSQIVTTNKSTPNCFSVYFQGLHLLPTYGLTPAESNTAAKNTNVKGAVFLVDPDDLRESGKPGR